MQVEASAVKAGDVLWHRTGQWVTVTEVRPVPATRNWRAITVRTPLGQELVIYVEHDLPVEVRRAAGS